MNLQALQHLAKAAQALADDCQIIVLGSASLLAWFPNLGFPDGPLASTYDADLCPQPFDEQTGRILEEALGESRAFHLRHGYHVDILRGAIVETLPAGWQERLAPVPGCANVLDVALLKRLHQENIIHADTVRQRLDSIPKSEQWILQSARAFDEVFGG
jgi:hypothetical protein